MSIVSFFTSLCGFGHKFLNPSNLPVSITIIERQKTHWVNISPHFALRRWFMGSLPPYQHSGNQIWGAEARRYFSATAVTETRGLTSVIHNQSWKITELNWLLRANSVNPESGEGGGLLKRKLKRVKKNLTSTTVYNLQIRWAVSLANRNYVAQFPHKVFNLQH